MSDEQKILDELADDMRIASAGRGVVLYLEGKTDVPILLALLGPSHERQVSRGVICDGVLVRGLGGMKDVERRIEVARHNAMPRIFGVIDGDGDSLATLAAEFDAPHPGPRFRWKTYCIENLLVRTAWPNAWGDPPDWRAVMASFAPYVAVNRLTSDLLARLKRLGLDRLINPTSAQDPRSVDAFLELLRAGRHQLTDLDIEAMFSKELTAVHTTFDTGLDAAHTLVNGKWLIDAFAARHTKLPAPQCRAQWTDHVRRSGGDPEILAWWRRTIAP